MPWMSPDDIPVPATIMLLFAVALGVTDWLFGDTAALIVLGVVLGVLFGFMWLVVLSDWRAERRWKKEIGA